MKHFFKSLTKVSKAYVVCLQESSPMEFDSIFQWIGYAALGLIVLWFLINRCWKYCRRRFRCEEENLEVIVPSTCSTTSSFTYMASVYPDYNLPRGFSDGLSDFDSSILFDQPMTLSSPNPYCKQSAERGNTSPEETIDRSSSSVIGRIGPRDDDLHSIHQIVHILNKSVLCLSLDEYDNMYGGMYAAERSDQNTSQSQQHNTAESTGSCVTQYNADIDIESQSTEEPRTESVLMHCELVTDV